MISLRKTYLVTESREQLCGLQVSLTENFRERFLYDTLLLSALLITREASQLKTTKEEVTRPTANESGASECAQIKL